MQTFMPHGNYVDSAKVLDTKRLGKQRVEAYQIIKAIRGDYNNTGAWTNHPATNMWRGHEYELALYGLTISIEFFERGHDGFNMVEIFSDLQQQYGKHNTEKYPWWVNNELLNLTHQSNLMRKDSEYYKFNVPADIPYVWPLATEQIFCLGSLDNGVNIDMLNDEIVYLTSQQVAKLLKLSTGTISAYKARNQMPSPDKVYGRTPLWKLETIKKWRGSLDNPIE